MSMPSTEVPTVLLVDDDPFLLESVSRSLRAEPYRLLVASSAEECLTTLEATEVDVLISDQKMPGALGTDLLEYVRSSRPETIRIMMSGETSLALALQAINECGVFRYLSKPCPARDIAMAIREGLLQREFVGQGKRLLELVAMQASYIRACEEGEEREPAPIQKYQKSYDLEALMREAVEEVEKNERALKEIVEKGNYRRSLEKKK